MLNDRQTEAAAPIPAVNPGSHLFWDRSATRVEVHGILFGALNIPAHLCTHRTIGFLSFSMPKPRKATPGERILSDNSV